jgi:anti-sigma B factor antagonist
MRANDTPWMEPLMHITARNSEDVVVFNLIGRLTINDGVDQLRDTVAGAIAAGHPKVVLNLANVPYIDSPALGELVHCLTSTRRAGGTVKLVGVNGRVVSLLTIMKLTAEFDTFDTEREAIESFPVTA